MMPPDTSDAMWDNVIQCYEAIWWSKALSPNSNDHKFARSQIAAICVTSIVFLALFSGINTGTTILFYNHFWTFDFNYSLLTNFVKMFLFEIFKMAGHTVMKLCRFDMQPNCQVRVYSFLLKHSWKVLAWPTSIVANGKLLELKHAGIWTLGIGFALNIY